MASISIQLTEDIRQKIRLIHKDMKERQVGINFSEADVVRHMMLPAIKKYIKEFDLAKKTESSGESQATAG